MNIKKTPFNIFNKNIIASKFLKLCKIETLEGKIFSSQESRLKVFILI